MNRPVDSVLWRLDPETAIFQDDPIEQLMMVTSNAHAFRDLPVGGIPPTVLADDQIAVV